MNWKFWKKQEIFEEVKTDPVTEIKTEPEPDISQPVYSLYNEIVHDSESWEYLIIYGDTRYSRNSLQLKHKDRDIKLIFRHSYLREAGIVCFNDFCTNDESLYLGKAFDIWFKKYTDNIEIERKKKNQLERERITMELRK